MKLRFDNGNRNIPCRPRRPIRRKDGFVTATAWGMSDCKKLCKRRNVYADMKTAMRANWNDTYQNCRGLLRLGIIEVME